MIVRLGADVSTRAMRATDLSAHFQRTGLPIQSFNTYERLAAFYNHESARGLSESALASAIQAKPDLFITGDKFRVAHGVLAVARTIRGGTAIADVPTSPSWEESYNMGLGKVTGNWADIPWGKFALAVGGVVLAYGFVSGMGRGVVSR